MPSFKQEMTTRLALAATTCTAIPVLVIFAYLRWKRAIRLELTTWRNGAGLTAMFLVFALWLIQTARWSFMSVNHEFTGFLGPSLREVETLLPAFYAYPALPLALALKGVPRFQMVAAWFLLAIFYGTFWYV
jgi:hypothetical protein